MNVEQTLWSFTDANSNNYTWQNAVQLGTQLFQHALTFIIILKPECKEVTNGCTLFMLETHLISTLRMMHHRQMILFWVIIGIIENKG